MGPLWLLLALLPLKAGTSPVAMPESAGGAPVYYTLGSQKVGPGGAAAAGQRWGGCAESPPPPGSVGLAPNRPCPPPLSHTRALTRSLQLCRAPRADTAPYPVFDPQEADPELWHMEGATTYRIPGLSAPGCFGFGFGARVGCQQPTPSPSPSQKQQLPSVPARLPHPLTKHPLPSANWPLAPPRSRLGCRR